MRFLRFFYFYAKKDRNIKFRSYKYFTVFVLYLSIVSEEAVQPAVVCPYILSFILYFLYTSPLCATVKQHALYPLRQEAQKVPGRM